MDRDLYALTFRPVRLAEIGPYQWAACSVSFDCPCGWQVVLIDEPRTCPDCARVYRLHAFVEIAEETIANG